jgi:hypothetical protein
MDPDMVRQQEEAEEEARRLKLGPRPVAAAMPTASVIAATPPLAEPEPRPAPKTEETETILAHVHMPGLPPVIPIKRKKRAAPPVDTRSRIGWFLGLRASLYALILSGLGLLGGMTVANQFGMPAMQSLGVGVGLGFLLGWAAAFASMRASRPIGFVWAVLISICPALIVLAVMIVALLIAQNAVGQGANAMADGKFWIIAGSGALLALIVSTLQTRKLTI